MSSEYEENNITLKTKYIDYLSDKEEHDDSVKNIIKDFKEYDKQMMVDRDYDSRNEEIEKILERNKENYGERAIVDAIAVRHLDSGMPTSGGGNKAADKDTDKDYGRLPWRFAEEIIQNADDCEYGDVSPKMEISIDEERQTITFSYNEKGFSAYDVYALCSYSNSTKTGKLVDRKSIKDGAFYKERTGKKGRGFKSAFALIECEMEGIKGEVDNIIVHVNSNGFSFLLDNQMGRSIPIWEENVESTKGNTVIQVEIKGKNKDSNPARIIYDKIKEKIGVNNQQDISQFFMNSSFIFLHQLKTITFKNIDKNDAIISSKRLSEIDDEYGEEIHIDKEESIRSGIKKGNNYYRWLWQREKISIDFNNANIDTVTIPIVHYICMKKEEDDVYRNYSIIAPLIMEKDVKDQKSHIKWNKGSLYCTLPIPNNPLTVPISIDAPFELNESREEVLYKETKNRSVRDILFGGEKYKPEDLINDDKEACVFDSFLLQLRKVESIRIDYYYPINQKEATLFDAKANSDGDKKFLQIINLYDRMKVLALLKKKVFNDKHPYVSMNEAIVLDGNLYDWKYADDFYKKFIESDYRENLVSDIYTNKRKITLENPKNKIINEYFVRKLNEYLDYIEENYKKDHKEEDFKCFIEQKLYPWLKDNWKTISEKADNCKELKILFSHKTKTKEEDEKEIIRENAYKDDCGRDTVWIKGKNIEKKYSIHRYRVMETSPIDCILCDSDYDEMKKSLFENVEIKSADEIFGEDNIISFANRMKNCEEIVELEEAAEYFGYSVDKLEKDKRFKKETRDLYAELRKQFWHIPEGEKQSIADINREENKNNNEDWDEALKKIQKKYMGNEDKKAYICAVSWFRNGGYTKAMGNGNIDSEKTIEEDYKEKPWKFLYEFIQNADDCYYSDSNPEMGISIDQDKGSISFSYNEKGFSYSDIDAITGFGMSNKSSEGSEQSKRDGLFYNKKTGKFGHGFKSVFSLPGDIIAHINSNGFMFRFDKKLGFIIPLWDDNKEMVSEGTEITVEGIEKECINSIINNIEEFIGISKKNSYSCFFGNSPCLFLKKIRKISINVKKNGENDKHYDICMKKNSGKDEFGSNYDVGENSVISGIHKEDGYKKDLAEYYNIKVKVSSDSLSDETVISAIRYSEMVELPEKKGIAVVSVFAPVITDNNKSYEGGCLYNTLPLRSSNFCLPLSINADFEVDMAREKANKESKYNKELLNYIINNLLKNFYEEYLSKQNNILIWKYLSLNSKNPIAPGFDKNLKMKEWKIFRPYDNTYANGFISYKCMQILPPELYKWQDPNLLFNSFREKNKSLAANIYAEDPGFFKELIIEPEKKDDFSDKINVYLNELESKINDPDIIKQQIIQIYEYINILWEKKEEEEEKDNLVKRLEGMKIFLFDVKDTVGIKTVRELAEEKDIIWLSDVTKEKSGFEKYRNIKRSSMDTDRYLWMSKVKKQKSIENAFRDAGKKNWDEVKSLIKAELYYDVCMPIDELKEYGLEVDEESNLFVKAYKACKELGENSGERIIKHLITENEDVEEIVRETGKNKKIVIERMHEMGVPKTPKYLDVEESGFYCFTKQTQAMLQEYCKDDYEKSRNTIKIVRESISSDKNKIAILSTNYDPAVIAAVLRDNIIVTDIQKYIKEKLYESNYDVKDPDIVEVMLRAPVKLEDSDLEEKNNKINLNISIKDIIDRKIGNLLRDTDKETLKICDIIINAKENKIIEYILESEDSDVEERARDLIAEKSNLTKRKTFSNTSCKYFLVENLKEAFDSKDDFYYIYDTENNSVYLDKESPESGRKAYLESIWDGKHAELVDCLKKTEEIYNYNESTRKDEWIKKLKECRELQKKCLKKLGINVENIINKFNESETDLKERIMSELLQNINDAQMSLPDTVHRELKIYFDKKYKTMTLKYNENGFTFSDVLSITAVGETNKLDEREGEKGIGFKRIFAFFDSVEIYSKGFRFRLRKRSETIPEWIEEKNYLDDNSNGYTVMLFKTKNDMDTLIDQIKDIIPYEYNSDSVERFVNSPISPLFLKINEISLFNDGVKRVYKKENLDGLFKYVSYSLKDAIEEIEEDITRENIEKELVRRTKYNKNDRAIDEIKKKEFNLCVYVGSKDLSGRFFSTLPTDNETHSGLFINMPLVLNTGRSGVLGIQDNQENCNKEHDNIIEDDVAYNRAIMKLFYEPIGDRKPIFVRMLEKLADNNKDLFVPSYLPRNKSEFDMFIKGDERFHEGILKYLKESAIVRDLSGNLTCMSRGYSVDKLVRDYGVEICERKEDLEKRIQSTNIWAEKIKMDDGKSERVLILPDKDENSYVLEEIAKENYLNMKDNYPLGSDSHVLTWEFLANVYSEEMDYSQDNSKCKFVRDHILPYLFKELDNNKDKAELKKHLENLYIFPCRKPGNISQLCKLGDNTWYQTDDENICSSDNYFVLDGEILDAEIECLDGNGEKISIQEKKELLKEWIPYYDYKIVIDKLLEDLQGLSFGDEEWWACVKNLYDLRNEVSKTTNLRVINTKDDYFVLGEAKCNERVKSLLKKYNIYKDVEDFGKEEYWKSFKTETEKNEAREFLVKLGVPNSFIVNGVVEDKLKEFISGPFELTVPDPKSSNMICSNVDQEEIEERMELWDGLLFNEEYGLIAKEEIKADDLINSMNSDNTDNADNADVNAKWKMYLALRAWKIEKINASSFLKAMDAYEKTWTPPYIADNYAIAVLDAIHQEPEYDKDIKIRLELEKAYERAEEINNSKNKIKLILGEKELSQLKLFGEENITIETIKKKIFEYFEIEDENKRNSIEKDPYLQSESIYTYSSDKYVSKGYLLSFKENGQELTPIMIICIPEEGIESENYVEEVIKLYIKNIHRIIDNRIHPVVGSRIKVRSKSEAIIYNTLYYFSMLREMSNINKDQSISFEYEKSKELSGEPILPDFTITVRNNSNNTPEKVYYWEHLGRMNDTGYRTDWEKKSCLYSKNEITEETNNSKNEFLIITMDEHIDPDNETISIIDSQLVERIAELLFETSFEQHDIEEIKGKTKEERIKDLTDNKYGEKKYIE